MLQGRECFIFNTLANHAGKLVDFSLYIHCIYYIPKCACELQCSFFFHWLGGQKQAQRVSKLIQACKHKLIKLLAQYSELGHDSGEERQHTIEEVCGLQSTFWIRSDHTYSASADPTTVIAPATQRRLIELHHF